MSTARSSARRRSSTPTSSAPLPCLRRRVPNGRPASGWSEGVRFHHVSTDEVYGSLAPGAPAFREDYALRAQLALCRLQGRQRSPGAGLRPHLRPAGDDQQLLEQLRAAPVPGEAHPAHDPQCARRQAAAHLRRRPPGARLAVRRGSLRAIRLVVDRGRPGETYNIGGGVPAAQTWRWSSTCAASWTSCARPRRTRRTAG